MCVLMLVLVVCADVLTCRKASRLCCEKSCKTSALFYADSVAMKYRRPRPICEPYAGCTYALTRTFIEARTLWRLDVQSRVRKSVTAARDVRWPAGFGQVEFHTPFGPWGRSLKLLEYLPAPLPLFSAANSSSSSSKKTKSNTDN